MEVVETEWTLGITNKPQITLNRGGDWKGRNSGRVTSGSSRGRTPGQTSVWDLPFMMGHVITFKRMERGE